MASKGDELQFVVRPLLPPSSSPDGAFRVHILPEHLEQAGLALGDLCTISNEHGEILGQGIAWRAADRMGSNSRIRPVKLSDVLKTTYLIKDGSQVVLGKAEGRIIKAEKLVLKDVTLGAPNASPEQELDDDKWLWRCGGALVNCEAIAPGMCFEVSAKKGLKKRFSIERIDSSGDVPDTRSLYHVDSGTKIVFDNEPGESTTASRTDLSPGQTITSEYIGGLTEQLQDLNAQLELALCETKEYRKQKTNYRTNRGVLIHGFEGTGKSLILDRLEKAKFCMVTCLNIDTLDGSTVSKNKDIIRKTFRDAQANQPNLVLMDDIHELAPANEKVYANVIATEMDKLKGSRVLIIASCRSLLDVNTKLTAPGRLSARLEIPIPDVHAREQILGVIMDEEPGLKRTLANAISLRTHGFTGMDLAYLLEEAESNALKRYRVHSDEKATASDIPNGSAHLNPASPVETPHQLQYEQVPVRADGEPSLTIRDFDVALTRVRPTALREIIFESPRIKWDDIGGSDEIRKRFDEIINWPLDHRDSMSVYYKQPKKGVLLYGPPGCSKTLTAKAVATQYSLNFITVKGAELISMYVGESERAVREIFRKARAAAPCVIFFDEIDSIASERESVSNKGLNVLTTLLNEMDGFDSLKGVLVLAATNKPDVLDPAIMRPGRFDSHFYLGPPNAAARREILEMQTNRLPTAIDLNVSELVTLSEGYSGAEIVHIGELATDDAMRRKIHSGDEQAGLVGMEDFHKAIRQTRRGISPEMLAAYDSFGEKAASG